MHVCIAEKELETKHNQLQLLEKGEARLTDAIAFPVRNDSPIYIKLIFVHVIYFFITISWGTHVSEIQIKVLCN